MDELDVVSESKSHGQEKDKMTNLAVFLQTDDAERRLSATRRESWVRLETLRSDRALRTAGCSMAPVSHFSTIPLNFFGGDDSFKGDPIPSQGHRKPKSSKRSVQKCEAQFQNKYQVYCTMNIIFCWQLERIPARQSS
jgi:hypothetical protein